MRRGYNSWQGNYNPVPRGALNYRPTHFQNTFPHQYKQNYNTSLNSMTGFEMDSWLRMPSVGTTPAHTIHPSDSEPGPARPPDLNNIPPYQRRAAQHNNVMYRRLGVDANEVYVMPDVRPDSRPDVHHRPRSNENLSRPSRSLSDSASSSSKSQLQNSCSSIPQVNGNSSSGPYETAISSTSAHEHNNINPVLKQEGCFIFIYYICLELNNFYYMIRYEKMYII